MRNAASMSDHTPDPQPVDPEKLAAAKKAAEDAVREVLGDDAATHDVVAIASRSLVLSVGDDGDVTFVSNLSMIASADVLISAASAILRGDLLPSNVDLHRNRNRQQLIQAGLEAGLTEEQVMDLLERLESDPTAMNLEQFDKLFREMFPDVVASQEAAEKAGQN